MTTLRVSITVDGTVQGVGARPFVFRVATRFGLDRYLRNESDRVYLEVEGDPTRVREFTRAFTVDVPSPADVQLVTVRDIAPARDSGFHIAGSVTGGPGDVSIVPERFDCAAR
jgi:hydrogenase maturation protein HypF